MSGDLATIDDNGYIFFQGRSDDMINSSGERIGPFEVESKLIEHPAVAEAGCHWKTRCGKRRNREGVYRLKEWL